MKKITLGFFLTAMCAIATAQVPGNALGVRFGGGDGVNAEISFEKFLVANNRLEFDLGFEDDGDDNGFKFTLLYQWVGEVGSGFYWYVGAGGSIGSQNVNEGNHGDDDISDGLFLDADGQLGLEYYFPIPLQLSIDWRPEFGIINDDFDNTLGLGIRFVF